MLHYIEQNKPKKDKDYREAIERALAALRARQFRYRAEEDSAYQQHIARQTRLARRAAEDVLAKTAALNGGRAHSFAQQLAQQQYNENIAHIGDILPGLRKQAREAYDKEQQQGLAEVDRLIGMENIAQKEYAQALAKWQQDRGYYYKKQQDAQKRADAQAAQAAKQSQGSGRRRRKKTSAVVEGLRSMLQGIARRAR